MENFNIRKSGGVVQSRNLLARDKAAWISARGYEKEGGNGFRPLKHTIADSAFDGSFDGFEQIAVQPHEHGLGLGIAETAIELQYHRAPSGHHKSAIENSAILGVFGLHARDDRARNVVEQPLRHGGIDQSVGRVSAHAAGICSSVIVSNAFVVLRGNQRSNAFSVAQHQERNLLALQEFFQHHAGCRRAQQLAVEHVSAGSSGFFFGGGNHTPPSPSPSLALYHNPRRKHSQRFPQLFFLLYYSVVRRGDVVALHEFFGKALA